MKKLKNFTIGLIILQAILFSLGVYFVIIGHTYIGFFNIIINTIGIWININTLDSINRNT